MQVNIYKVGAVILRNGHLLVVRKDVPNRREYIVPGGKAEKSEQPLDTLRRELWEELGVGISNPKWFGRFEDIATFEEVPILMDVYLVEIKGEPSAQSEIREFLWIDRNYHKEGVLLGNVLEQHIVPELMRRGLF